MGYAKSKVTLKSVHNHNSIYETALDCAYFGVLMGVFKL